MQALLYKYFPKTAENKRLFHHILCQSVILSCNYRSQTEILDFSTVLTEFMCFSTYIDVFESIALPLMLICISLLIPAGSFYLLADTDGNKSTIN